jgi:hypothetical protein
VDGLVRTRVERELGGLVALADDPQRRLVTGAAEIVDVRAAGFGHTKSVESQQADQRIGVPALSFGGGQQVGQLVAVQPRLRSCVSTWPADPGGGIADVDFLVFEPGEPRRQRRDPPPHCRVRQHRDLLLELTQVHLDMGATDANVRVNALGSAVVQPAAEIAAVALAGVRRPEASEERNHSIERVTPGIAVGQRGEQGRCRHDDRLPSRVGDGSQPPTTSTVYR